MKTGRIPWLAGSVASMTRQAVRDVADVGAAAGRVGKLALERGASALAYDAAAGAVGVVVVLGIAVGLAASRGA